MNTESIDCRKVANFEALERPGDFYFQRVDGMSGETCLHIMIPDGAFICIGVQRGGPGGPKVWGWDGNEERPTIQPSILCTGHWHGYLEAGRLRSC